MLLYCYFIILILYLPAVFQVFKNKQQKEKAHYHETTNGVTVHRITEEVDQGGIIFQEAYFITPLTISLRQETRQTL